MNAGTSRTTATLLLLSGLLLAGLYLLANPPAGTFGMATTFEPRAAVAKIDALVPGGPADRLGLNPGDTLRASGSGLSARAQLYLLANQPIVAAGDRVTFERRRGASQKLIQLVATPNASSPPFEATYFAILATPILFLGWLIIWKRPRSGDALTLGLMLLVFGMWIATPDRFGPPLVRLWLNEVTSSAFVIIGVMFAVVFFARYPEGRGVKSSPIRSMLLYVAAFVTLIELLSMTLSFALPAYTGSTDWLVIPTIVVAIIPNLIIYWLFFDSMKRSDPAERTRLRWLGGSYIVGFSGPLLIPAALLLLGSRFTVIHQVLLESTLFVLAIGLTYGILRYRVFDFTFVLSRAAVFGLTSAVVIGLFACFQWFANRILAQSNYAFAFQIAAAILIGLSLQRLYRYVEQVINTYAFATHHRALVTCARIRHAFGYAETMPAIHDLLTQETCAALNLASAALFQRGANGIFELASNVNWEPACRTTFEIDDSFVLYLGAEGAPITMRSLGRTLDGVPTGNREPVIAVPLLVRRDLAGFVLYGGHPHGSDLDPDETAALRALAEAGSRAFEALSLAERVAAANRARDQAQQAQVEELREYNEAYGRFVPTQFLQLLGKDDIRHIGLGDHIEREMTVFFCDIRSFTTLSWQMSAEENFRFINAYLRRVGPLIREHHGFIDKYIGDAIMGLFPNSASDGLRAAVALHHELRLYNRLREAQRFASISVGVGLHTGPLMLGTVGERERMDSTVISDAVNISSRLEALTKMYGASIILSDQTYRSLDDPDAYLLRRLGKATVRGRSEPIELWEAFDGDPADHKSLKHRYAAEFAAGVEALENDDLLTAKQHLLRCVESNPHDLPAAHLLSRCSG